MQCFDNEKKKQNKTFDVDSIKAVNVCVFRNKSFFDFIMISNYSKEKRKNYKIKFSKIIFQKKHLLNFIKSTVCLNMPGEFILFQIQFHHNTQMTFCKLENCQMLFFFSHRRQYTIYIPLVYTVFVLTG